VASSFDAADRITTAGYTYDGLGRTRTVPAAHTDQPSGSNLAANYFGTDMVAKLTQTTSAGVRSKSFGLDPSLRLSTLSYSTGGVELRKTVNHYVDGSDSPSWIATQTRTDALTGWTSSWTRNVAGPDGKLVMIQPQTGAVKVQLANLHGDVVATLDNGPFVGFDAYVESTEYGQSRTVGASLGQNYGWLGAERRSTDSVGGLTLMGARLYNPIAGRFLSRDPVPGGNDNTYIYPADPINMVDLDGAFGLPRFVKKAGNYLNKHKGTIATYAGAAAAGFACGASVICAVGVGASMGVGKYVVRKKGKNLTVPGLVGAGAAGGAAGAAGKVVKNLRHLQKVKPQHRGALNPRPRAKPIKSHKGKRSVRKL
jgi:RHS repeat-associated protein